MILFGTAGVPSSTASGKTEDGVREIKRLGLDSMEVEFVHGVRMKPKAAMAIGEVRAETGITLTAHGPYYINLCSEDPEKKEASIKRVMDTARIAHAFGGKSVTFHAAFYQGRDPRQIFEEVAEALTRIIKDLAAEGIDVPLAPELTGKPSQFGSIDELIALGRAVPGLRLCVDFSHHAARSAGADNNYEAFCAVLDKIKKGLGQKALKELHMHVSGIEWTGKGEYKHLELRKSKFDWKGLLRALIDRKVSGLVVCESPILEKDALVLQKEYRRLIKGREE